MLQACGFAFYSPLFKPCQAPEARVIQWTPRPEQGTCSGLGAPPEFCPDQIGDGA
jgi:hypothetical protein